MEWIAYGDGWEFTSEDGGPEDVPGRGVQIIAQVHPEHGRQLVISRPDYGWGGYYWWTEDGWYGGDMIGMLDYLMEPGFKVVKFGRSVPDLQFREVLRRANEDERLPPRSASTKQEARWLM